MVRADGGSDRIRMRAVFKAVGTRSYGPLLLLAGLVTLAPVIGDIPGVPTVIGVFVVLISVQLLCRRDHFWLPGWILNRSAPRAKFRKAVGWMRRPARVTDKILRRRLPFFTTGPAQLTAGVVCLLIGAAMPLMEFVPFSANGAGAALAAFGLSFVAKDGLLALVAFVFSLATFSISAYDRAPGATSAACRYLTRGPRPVHPASRRAAVVSTTKLQIPRGRSRSARTAGCAPSNSSARASSVLPGS